MLGSVFGRTDFSRIFIFGPPDFPADFLAGFFLLIFVGKSAQKNPPGKSPAKSSKNYTAKIPDTVLQRGRAKRCPSQTPDIARSPRQEKAMMHCDLRVRWKVASDLRFRAAISEPKTPSFCGISGDLAPSTRKSLAIAIVRFWCAKS